MTTFNYNIKIISKDIPTNSMVVEYTPIDNDVLTALIAVNSSSVIGDEIVSSTETVARGKYLLTIPIPFTDQDLVEYIKSYAPLGVWEKMISDSQKQISDISVGESIAITGHSQAIQAITSMSNFDDLPYIPHPTISL